MWSLRKPAAADIRAFLSRQANAPFSYADVGRSRTGGAAGYDLDHNRVVLGHGPAVFQAACTALRQWRMFPPSFTRVEPPDALLAPGAVVAVLARAFGVWWLNAARIVYVIDEPRRFGFAYGTLPEHVERGEERFTVEWAADDSVWYDLFAFSRPRLWMVRLAYPLARHLQRRFQAESKAAMLSAVAGRSS
jgi:uncharacterized protein (UPF0548 family)